MTTKYNETSCILESQSIRLNFTGKSLSEALFFAEHGVNMLCTKIVLNVRNNFCTQHVLPRFELGIFMYWTCNSMNNLSSYCGLCSWCKNKSFWQRFTCNYNNQLWTVANQSIIALSDFVARALIITYRLTYVYLHMFLEKMMTSENGS